MKPLAMLQMLRFALLTAVVLYVVVGEMVAPKHAAQPLPILFHVFTILAIGTVGIAFMMRRLMMKPADPNASGSVDPSLVNRWRTANILSYAIADAVALFGLVLRTLGFSFSQVVPFYLSGFILIMFLAPRLPSNQVA